VMRWWRVRFWPKPAVLLMFFQVHFAMAAANRRHG
jgi:hypothetical protein